ncbi:ATP-binding cassette sub-family B member 10, mitochondrial isoform X2 [Saccopteryx leptura]|uniref:ATP-binding cassette sub-family B member 10, mitochondrial isoform X2 n=1 Tax=Saccopteryx leptura TaxID=249018 RepID=UPI00339BF6FC
MRSSATWPLRLLVRRGPLARAWTPAARTLVSRPQPAGLGPLRLWGAGLGLLGGAGAGRSQRRWASSCPVGGPGGPSGGAGLARLLGLWARSPGACRCGALAGPAGLRLPRAVLPGGFAVVACAGGEAWRRGPVSPAATARKDDSRLRPAAAGRPEALKLLGLAYPERRRLASQRIVNRLRTSLFSSILKQEVAFFDKTRTGELINRLSSDTALLGRSVTENLSDGLRAGAQASVGIGMMFFVSPHLATFVLSVVPLISILAVIYGRYLRKLTKVTQNSLAQATQLAEERIGNIRTVRSFGKEIAEMEKYTSKVDGVMQLARKEAFARAGFFGATGLSGNLIVLSVLYKGGQLMGGAQMTVGELSSFLMYAFWVGVSIGGLSSFYSELMKGLGAGGRLWELLERKPELPFNDGLILNEKNFQGALEFKNVHFTYPARPEVSIFQDFSLSIPSGSITALVGPSGSGKSTVVSLLLRFYDPISGTISLDGRDIRQLNPLWLRSKIGTVSQEPILFSCSIAENIAYGADDPSLVTVEQVQKVADTANAAAFIQNFPQGYNTVVGEKGVLLSGGQKQRIAIARALLKNPKILLLDEATSALDAENEYLVQEALDRLTEGRTVLIIAHRLSTIKNANMVAVLDQGKIIECGKHEELLSKPDGIYRKLMNKQSFISA